MSLSKEELAELVRLFSEIRSADEAGVTYYLLPNLQLPPGCNPASVDALLCPSPLDGYESRLFYALQVKGGPPRNWHVQGRRILERNWYAFSWKTCSGLRAVQMILRASRWSEREAPVEPTSPSATTPLDR